MLKEPLKLINGGLLETPSQRSLKKIFIGSLILLILSVPTTLYLLETSNFSGELERTQLGFDAEYIRECLVAMDGDGNSFFIWGNLVDYVFMFSYGCLFFSSSERGNVCQLVY